MLGQKSIYAKQLYDQGYVGIGFFENIDFTDKLPDNWRDFNKEFIPLYLSENPEKTKVAAGLACGFTWTVSKGISRGDIVICPNGEGAYYVGEIVSDYEHRKGEALPHRRKVNWFNRLIDKEEMSQELKNSVGSIGTVSNITKYGNEVERLLGGATISGIIATDETIEDPATFVLEKHLEDFLVQNWSQTVLGKNYDIFKDEGQLVGQQYPSDTGPIDILAISKDKKELLVVELKKGRISDVVVGQIQRYMGYVKEELAEEGQVVRGVIVALEDDIRLRRALSVASNIDFYKYEVKFRLEKG